MAIAYHLGVPPDNVTVKIGRNAQDEGLNGSRNRRRRHHQEGVETEELIVTVHKPGVDLEEPRLKAEIRAKLAELKPLADNALMVPLDQLALRLKANIEEVTKDTNFNKDLLKWKGFDPNIINAGRGHEVGDYALQNVRSNSYGIWLNLHFGHANGEDVSKEVKEFSDITMGRLEAIRQILIARTIKYAKLNLLQKPLNAQEMQQVEAKAKAQGMDVKDVAAMTIQEKAQALETKIRADFADLKIEVSTDPAAHENLVVTMRSKAQAEAYEANKADPNRDTEYAALPPEPANFPKSNPPVSYPDYLLNSNPLTSLEVGLTKVAKPATDTTPEVQPQLHKTLARGLLFDQEKNLAPGAMRVLGRNDIKAAIIKELMLRVLPKHPEKKDEIVTKIINSEIFKNHGSWHATPGTVGSGRLEPEISRLGSNNDTLEFAFTLRTDKEPAKNQLLQVVEALANPNAITVAPGTVTPAKVEPAPVTPAVVEPAADANTTVVTVTPTAVDPATAAVSAAAAATTVTVNIPGTEVNASGAVANVTSTVDQKTATAESMAAKLGISPKGPAGAATLAEGATVSYASAAVDQKAAKNEAGIGLGTTAA
jgi:hypothetical protein